MAQNLFPLSRSFLKNNNRPYRRFLLSRSPFNHDFVILLGQRGVGKTTLLVQYLHSISADALTTQNLLYVPADHFLVGESSLYEIAESFHNLGGETLCIDEIHKYSGWSSELKSIRDSFPRLRLLVSGSSALRIIQGSHDLSRRALIVNLPGMSFREYVEVRLNETFFEASLDSVLAQHEKLTEAIIDTVERQGSKILLLFQQYLSAGYYPFGLGLSDVDLYHVLVEQALHAAIENDLPAVHESLTGTTIKRIKKLLSILASSVPFTPDLSKLKVALDIGDERTLKTYLGYLEDAGAISMVCRAGGKIRSLSKPEKIYLNNPNQMFSVTSGTPDIGTLRETFLRSMVSLNHEIAVPERGDFLIDNEITIEVGGKNKDFSQLRGVGNSYLAVDDIERGSAGRIPLWLFGFLY